MTQRRKGLPSVVEKEGPHLKVMFERGSLPRTKRELLEALDRLPEGLYSYSELRNLGRGREALKQLLDTYPRMDRIPELALTTKGYEDFMKSVNPTRVRRYMYLKRAIFHPAG